MTRRKREAKLEEQQDMLNAIQQMDDETANLTDAIQSIKIV